MINVQASRAKGVGRVGKMFFDVQASWAEGVGWVVIVRQS
jgi:hypothetical protein